MKEHGVESYTEHLLLVCTKMTAQKRLPDFGRLRGTSSIGPRELGFSIASLDG